MRSIRFCLCTALPLFAGFVLAAEAPAAFSDCTRIADNSLRLACFDQLAATVSQPPAEQPAGVAPVMAPPANTEVAEARKGRPGFSLSDHWELDPAHKRGIFKFRPHATNYLIGNYTHAPNDAPYRPFQRLTGGEARLSHSELVFQLGFKMKLVEEAFSQPVDLWFGYTQNSFWQAGNDKASSPFRETNYQPEFIATVPLGFDVLGLSARFINFGFVHQSNGQASTLSRSWNRVYAQLGMERGGLTLSARACTRLSEPRETDDNPDITKYMGHGDIVAVYRNSGHEFSALLRRNLHTDKGAVQLGWAWPIAGQLKGYTQVFYGYGQSLIDYNYFHRSIGVGLQANF
jgi:phospholipase A1/A2